MKWIAMAGLRGCMPNTVEEFDSRRDAIEHLLLLHEIDANSDIGKALRGYGFASLNLQEHGNEYLQVEAA